MHQPTQERTLGAALIAAAAVCVAGYAISARTLVDHDAFVMGEVARRVVEGERLYRQAWDNKAPLALLFYAPPQAVAPGSYLVQQLYGALWTLLQAALAYALLRRESALVRAATTALVLLLPLSRSDFIWVSSEDSVNVFGLPLLLIGYRIFRRSAWLAWEAWLSGALAVLAFHCRQPGILFAAVPALGICFATAPARARILALVQACGGALLAWGAVLAVVLTTTDFDAYVDAMFVAPRRYGVFDLAMLHWALREQLVVLRTHPYLVMLLFALFLAGDARDRWFTLATAAVSAAVVLAPCKIFGHYQEQLIPMIALSALIALRGLEARAPASARAYAGALVLFYFGNAFVTAELLRNDHGEKAELDAIVAALRDEHARRNGRVLAVGKNSAYVYFKSHVPPAYAQVHWDMFFDVSYVPEPPDTIVANILKRPPEYLVIDQPSHAAYTADPYAERPGAERLSRLVHELCKAHGCVPLAWTPRWLLLSLH